MTILFASLADLPAANAGELGFTDLLVYAEPPLFWDAGTTRQRIAETAGKMRSAAGTLAVHVAHWCFAPGATLNPWAATDEQWRVYMERLRWWSEEAAAHHFVGIAMDAEHYPSTPGSSGGAMSPKTAWLDPPGFAERGRQYAAACRSALPRAVLSNFVTWWTVRQGNGLREGGAIRLPMTGYFNFWNAVYEASNGGLFLDEATYEWKLPDGLPKEQADVKESLPAARWVPGIWLKANNPLSIVAACREMAGAFWIYSDGKALADPTERGRLKAALGA